MTTAATRTITRAGAHPSFVAGAVVRARLPDAFIGELCDVFESAWSDRCIARAQVIALQDDMATLSLLGDAAGLSRACVIVPGGSAQRLAVHDGMLGAVLAADGTVRERMSPGAGDAPQAVQHRLVDGAPPQFNERALIDTPFVTGVRAIDALLTCGRGQRIGIFAPAGCGKTSLVSMLMSHSTADVYVVALVGERGREVTEFVQEKIPADKRDRTVVIYSTSDSPPVERRNAALMATTLAEYFRDRGADVLLMVDSISRYARALRDLALASGQLPARRGFPASVFEELPRLLERPGGTAAGCITAFFTVLLEDELESDPVGEEVRATLDGHIYLSSKLAGVGHFPAIDMLRSASRVADRVTSAPHRAATQRLREKLARLADAQTIIDLGEYRPGDNPELDDLLAQKDDINAFLRQPIDAGEAYERTLEVLDALA